MLKYKLKVIIVNSAVNFIVECIVENKFPRSREKTLYLLRNI